MKYLHDHESKPSSMRLMSLVSLLAAIGPLSANLETDVEFDGAFRYFYKHRTKELPIP